MDKREKQKQLFERLKFHHGRHPAHDHIFEELIQHRMYRREFHRMHRSMKYFRPFALLFNLLIIYLLFTLAGMKVFVLVIAALLVAKEMVQVFFLLRLEKRVFKPLEELKNGVEEVARGNYNVKVKCDLDNEIGLLVASFNEMARKLGESERLKSAYEENRKTFIANVSHDLKTPVASLQGYVEAMLDKDIPPENKINYLQVIHRNIIYVNRLIDDLFLFAKLDMQKLDFRFEVVPVRAFMGDLTEEFRFELAEKQVRLEYADKMEQDLPVRMDRKRLRQAIGNVIGNALKYGPEQGLVIKIELWEEGGSVSVELSDNGPGIPADKLPYIFDRFYRIDHERTKDLMSTGLGLAIARELVEAHGGGITAASEEGRGACFRITLPAAGGRESR